MSTQEQTTAGANGAGEALETLTVTDNRTGRRYEIPIVDGAIRSLDLRQIRTSEDDFGLLAYDPAFMNTASCRSAITFLDGDAGVLQYRGYPIEQLAEHSSYLEVAYLLIHGELPTAAQLEEWTHLITIHTFVHENIKGFMEGFRHDAHPMGMLLGSVGALSTFYPDANRIQDADNRAIQTIRLIAKMPTLAAFSYRHNMGMPYVYPDNDLNYAGNLLGMLYKMTELKYQPDPRIERALDILFILHADHEQNCSTSAVRAIGSSLVDPYSAVAGGIAALYGPSHGGANEEVVRMLHRIERAENIPDFIAGVKAGNERLMGFGHRVYKNYDPRARIIKSACEDVFEVTGINPLLAIATELEKIALEDEYFVSRKLYPNVDFYSGLIYEALGMPMSMFPVMFAIARTSGWIAQWLEMVQDPEQKIARPRQIYTGERGRDYVPVEQRS
jgi:citrate synthase